MAFEGIVHVQVTKAGFSKLFRINLNQAAKDFTQVKPCMTFDYRKEEVHSIMPRSKLNALRGHALSLKKKGDELIE